jgi:hypothetical protein
MGFCIINVYIISRIWKLYNSVIVLLVVVQWIQESELLYERFFDSVELWLS